MVETLLALGVILMLACVFVEIKIVDTVKPLFKVLSKYRLLSLGFSLVLSVFLGGLFGAAGLIIMFAGVLSTVLVQPVYALMKSGHWDKGKAKYADSKAQWAENKDVYFHRLHQLHMIGLAMCWIISRPFKLIFWLMDKGEVMVKTVSSAESD